MLRRRWEVLPYYTNPPGHTGQDHPMCGEPAEPGTMAIEKFWTRWFAERAARSYNSGGLGFGFIIYRAVRR